MIPESTPVLLDTGIAIHLCRGGTAAQRLEARYGLAARRQVPWLSVVSVGELRAFAERNRWGGDKRERLAELLASLVVVDIRREPVLDQYARLDAHLSAIGRRMGQQNDLWIAATAAATGALILTTDTDFDDLHPAHLQREWIDPRTLR